MENFGNDKRGGAASIGGIAAVSLGIPSPDPSIVVIISGAGGGGPPRGGGVFFFAGTSLPVAGFVVEFTFFGISTNTTNRWNIRGSLNWTRKTTGTVSPRVTVGDNTDNSPIQGQSSQYVLSSGNNWFTRFTELNVLFTNGTPRQVYCNVGGVPATSAGTFPLWS